MVFIGKPMEGIMKKVLEIGLARVFIAILTLSFLFSSNAAGAASGDTLKQTVTVYYSYGPDGTVVFSQNNFEIFIGQKLAVQRASNSPQELRNVRLMSSAGDRNFYDVLEFVEAIDWANPPEEKRFDGIVYVARKTGTGRLQVVPNYSDWDKAGFLTVTVKP